MTDEYQPEPPLTPEERDAIESIKRRAARRAAAKELAQHRRTWGPVLVIDKTTGEATFVPGSATVETVAEAASLEATRWHPVGPEWADG